MKSHFEGMEAVVTGGGSGIGRAIARRLGARGARVHVADRDGDAAERVAEELGDGLAYTVDVTDAKAVAGLAHRVYGVTDRVDLLFNNAGIGHAGLIQDTELEDWRRVLDVNIMGVVHGLHAFLPRLQMQPGGAHIINTASAAGLVAPPRMGAYVASKHAVVGLSQSLAAELKDSDIGVTILCPGIINTRIVAMSEMRGESARYQDRLVDYYRTRGASPDKVAQDVLTAVTKNHLFCITPRTQVGLGWLAQRLSPRLAQTLGRINVRGMMRDE